MFFHGLMGLASRPLLSIGLGVVFGLGLMNVPDARSQDREYQLASRLMQQKKYAQACPMFETLHKTYPSRFLFFEKRVECLLMLNETEQAIETAEAQFRAESAEGSTVRLETELLLAETLHAGERIADATAIWRSMMEGAGLEGAGLEGVGVNGAGVDGARRVGAGLDETGTSMLIRSLENRREFAMAAEAVVQFRERTGRPEWYRQILSELYMQGGEFEKGVRELYEFVIGDPQAMLQVQQRLLRMREASLYEIAAVELEDRLFTLDEDHEAYGQLFQLLSWLYLETENYDRALRFARRYESRTDRARQQVYVLGLKFRSAHQYELAVEAFRFYEQDDSNLRWRALEEMGTTYREWAIYIEEKGLIQGPASSELYDQSYQTYEELYEAAPSYSNTENVLISLLDLSLDVYHDTILATKWLEALQSRSGDGAETAYTHYAAGRVHLFEEEYRPARQRFTRADRLTQDANLSEKIRYHASLADLFAGDAEFAVIQLASLQRRSSSWYANEAITLEQWIQSGLRADSTGSKLQEFTSLYRRLLQGQYDEALDQSGWVTGQPDHPFASHASLQLARRLPSSYAPQAYSILQQTTSLFESSPIHERLLWEQAKLARVLMDHSSNGDSSNGDSSKSDNRNSDNRNSDNRNSDSPILSIEPDEWNRIIEDLYDTLLIRYPGGYYAELARAYLSRQAEPASS